MKMTMEHHFDLMTIILHWGMAFIIFFLFGLGLYMVELTYYDAWYVGSTSLHKSVGMCLFALLCFRLAWRIGALSCQLRQLHVTVRKNPEEALAVLMHVFLYLLMLAVSLSGYLISTAGNREIDIFSLFTIPPLAVSIENQEDIAGVWHFYLAWIMIIMVCCHTLAALKHHFIDKDSVLKNMLRPSKITKGDFNEKT